ncbi:hypothetical protein N0V82_004273 [Gnomoniopsis sp. IMI 355080]|nr:hypothetical protein N0V82_004273 [Gnomoniopsis sp. IMI 355080]
MHYTTGVFYTIISLASLAQADFQLDEDDISQTCQSICRPIRELSNICDVDGDQVGGQATEDSLTLQCICTNTSFDVGSVAAECQSCMQQNPDDTEDVADDMKDINEIVARCGFSPATYTSDEGNSASTIVVNAVRPTAATQLTTSISSSVQPTAIGTVSGTTAGTTATGLTTATGTAAIADATTTGGAVSGVSDLGSLSRSWTMMLTYVIGAAGVGAWLF